MSYKLDSTELKMINFSLFRKNESEFDGMGNMESPKTIDQSNNNQLYPQCSTDFHVHHWKRFGVDCHIDNFFAPFSTVHSLLVQSRSVRPSCRTCSSTGLHFQCSYLLRQQLSFKTSDRGHVVCTCGVYLSTMTAISMDQFLALRYAICFVRMCVRTCIIYCSRHLVGVSYFVMSQDNLEKKSFFPCHRCRWRCYLPLYFNLFVYQNLSNCKASQVGYSITTTYHTNVEC